MLLRLFEGTAAEPFAHAVTTAYYWSIEQMRRMLLGAGFHVIDIQTRKDPGRRPHAAIAAALP